MEYKNVVLFGLGILGIMLHCLFKIISLKKSGKVFKANEYMNMEWPNIAVSVIAVVIAIVCKGEVKKLEEAGNYLGFGFVAIGFMAQSILVTLFGKVSGVLGIKEEDK